MIEQGPIEPSTRNDKRYMRVVRLVENGKTLRKKTVHFGDPNMTIGRDDPKRRASYCARSAGIPGYDDPFSANYQSRQMWGCDTPDLPLDVLP
jgi:hypothetical protein